LLDDVAGLGVDLAELPIVGERGGVAAAFLEAQFEEALLDGVEFLVAAGKEAGVPDVGVATGEKERDRDQEEELKENPVQRLTCALPHGAAAFRGRFRWVKKRPGKRCS
jgi:hypothetical protein